MADVELNLNGNIVNQFKALAKEASEAQKSIERLKKQMESMTAKGSPAFNSKTSQILSSTSFSSIQDLFAEIKSNKLMGAPGGTQTAQAAKQLTNLRNILKSVGNKELQEDIGGVTGRIDNVVRAMSGKAPGKNTLSQVMIPDAQLKGHEEEIKKSILGISDYIIKLEKSLTGINSVAQKEYKKANPSKTAAGTKIRGKDFSYDYDRYQSDAKYVKQVDELKLYYKRKADNYGQIGESAMQNAAFRGQKVFGSQSGQFSGFFQEIIQGFKNGINDGMKDFDLGELFSNTLKKGDKSRKQKKVLNNFGYDSDFITNTDAFMNTASFKKFAEEQKKKLSDIVNLSDKDVLRGMSKEDRARVLGDVRKNREIDFDKLSNKDRNKVFAGLVNNKGAKKVMGGIGMGGVFLSAAAGVGKLTEAAVKLGTEAVKAYEGVQQLQTQLGVVFGSNIQSDKMFQDIEAYAKKSPFGVETMTQQAVLLKQSGVYASELMDTMKRIGDLSSGNNEKMKSVSQVYARVMSSQTVTARDMRQLSTAGVPSYSALADAMGVDRGQIRSKLQAGQVSATDFQKMIENLTSKGGMFYGATERGAQTIAARKQNLADTKQMAYSSLGELIAKAGSSTNSTADSYYGKALGILEQMYSWMEGFFDKFNKKNAVEAPEEAEKKYKELIAKSKDVSLSYDERVKAGEEAKKIADSWGTIKGNAISAGDFLYKQNTQVKNDTTSAMQKIFGLDEKATAKEIADQLKYVQWQTSNEHSYIEQDKYGRDQKAFKDLEKDFEEFKKQNPESSAKQMTANQLRDAYENVSGDFGKYASTLQAPEYQIEHYFAEIVNATQEGVESMDKQINNVRDTFDKFETVNFGKKGVDGYGAQHLMSAARDDYQNNSSVWQMSWKDQKAYWDEQAKKEIEHYSSKTKKGKDENGNDIYSMAGLTAEEMQKAQELLTSSSEAIQMLAHPENATMLTPDGQKMTEQTAQDVNDLLKNMTELAQVAANTGGEDVFGPDFMKGLEDITKLLGDKNFGNDAVKNIEKVVDLLNNGLVGSLNTQLANANLPPEAKAALLAMQANVQQSMSTHTYNDDTKWINRRKQPSLRAHVLSDITGVSAERVANSKESSVMNAYLNNFSQRQAFAQLGKALMQNGAELKDVAKAMQEGKNGQKYGMYDWNKSTSSIEEQAAQKNVATQEALIAAYQQQIDALHELTVGSIATRDQWDNLNSLSAQLGVGFELAAKELADGTVQFTDVTIQSAHKMLEELNIKKFNQQMDTILNRVVEDLKDKQKEASLETSVLTGGMGHYVTNENAGRYVQVAKGQAAEIAKTEIPVLVNKVWKEGGLVFDSKEGAENQAREFQKLFKDRTIKVQAVTVQEGKEGNFAKLNATANANLYAQWKKEQGDKPKQSFKDWAYEEVPWALDRGRKRTRWEIGFSDVLNANGYGRPIFGGGDRGGGENAQDRFYLTSIAGKKESEYKASAKEAKTAYQIEGLSKKEVEDSIRSLVAALNDGTLPRELETLFLALTGLDQTENELTKKIEDNTVAQSTNDAIKEVHQLSDQFKAYFGSIGIMGNTPEAREAAKLREESKAFKDMERHSPMMNHANTPDREAMMALLGIDRHADYEAYRLRRMGEALNFEDIGLDKNKNKLLDKDDLKGVERDKNGNIKDLKLRSDEVTQANVKNFLVNGEGRGYTRKLFNNKKDTEYKDEHETLDSFKGAIENMDSSAIDALIEKLKEMGVPLEDFVRKMQESSEFTMVANDKIKDMTDTLKDSSFSTAVNLVNSGLKQAGDNAYKLDNNLIKGKDAAKATKQALAGVQAALLESIGAAMTQTGLSIAAGAAKDGLWSMVAMGLALAAAGGVASFGSGMMSAYANDKSKDKSSEEEDRLKRLEDLKNNLADLLKQAKDDAIYYETNLRQKQAVAFNDAVSSTNVNDAIITPRGVVNTAPDDYIMAMKDPTHLLGKGGGGTNVSFSIVNESGTPMTVTRSETREGSGGTEIVAFVNAIVQKSMNDGEYDDVMAGMQVRQKGSQISS